MHFLTILVTLASATFVAADTHKSLYCTSHIQPYNNNNSCAGAKRELTSPNTARMLEKRAYADNLAATQKACAAYRNRNTGTKVWDTCPDCHMVKYKTPDPAFCVRTCDSPAGHLGGDEFLYYCKQAGADGSTDI